MYNTKAVFVVGPTASGKTALSIALAKQLQGEIINADSMQIYKELNIGSAKPTPQEQQGIEHHMLNVVGIGEEFSVALYRSMAMADMREIWNREKLPIICGGTGLYINALTYQMDFTGAKGDPELRKKLMQLAETEGVQAVYARLEQVDPITAERLHPNNTRRVIRALEVYELTGVPLSEQTQSFQSQPAVDYAICMIGLKWDREQLNARISQRVDSMMKSGLYQEARALFAKGIDLQHPSMMGLGYRQLYAHFCGKMSLDEAIERIKQETRRYAKRQMTWFQRDLRIHWLEPAQFTSLDCLTNAAMDIIKNTLYES